MDKIEILPESEFNAPAPAVGFYDLPDHVYRSAPGCNWSAIKRILKTPKTYRWFADNLDEDSDDKKKGRLYHTLLLEPHLLDERWIAHPLTYPSTPKTKSDKPKPMKWNMNANHCKDWVAEHEKKGLGVVRERDISFGRKMVGELIALPDARLVLDGADGYEVSAFWVDEETGLLCKCRIDILKNGQIGDFKKLAASHKPTASWENWCGHIRGWRYDGQAAHYRNGVNAVYKHLGLDLPEIPQFTWLVVEDARPFDTAIYSIYDVPEAASYQFFVWGRELCRFLLKQVAFWEEHDEWPSYNIGPSGVTEDHELEPPDWLRLEIK